MKLVHFIKAHHAKGYETRDKQILHASQPLSIRLAFGLLTGDSYPGPATGHLIQRSMTGAWLETGDFFSGE
ncbi:hypothetical protein Q669_25755 [Labrenzia sp. C1B10]|nr:hypothetical protein Q669_25755 [Labrenzia sp. C1B10]ERS08931.1 hypothetical protein Q675_16100 [Labrenzia sp. C1B70]